MENHTLSILVMVICVSLSAFFSASETAFNSVNKIKLKSLSDDGNKKAGEVLAIAEKYDKFLSTILIGNNVVNILFTSLLTVIFVAVSQTYGATISTAVGTVVILLFGEITPKVLSKKSPEKFAMAALPIVKFFTAILTPLSFIFSLWTKFISKAFRSSGDASITDDELITIVNEAYHEGGIDEHESELIKNAIVFDDRQAEDILTPRVDIVAVPIDSEEDEVLKIFSETGYSRLPVYEGSLDNIIGIIHQKDFYEDVVDNEKSLSDILQEALFVTPTMKIGSLLRELQMKKEHIAVVVDEYGGTAGLVTMEDILEELVGEIWDEHDEIVEDVVKVSDDTYIVQGNLLVEDMFEYFDIRLDESDADTVSGWIMEQMGHIPEENETFSYENLDIQIAKVVSRRITEVKVTVHEKPSAEEETEEE